MHEEILQELRKQTALLRKLVHQRRGLSEADRERLLSALDEKRFLTTSEVMTLLNISRDTALKLMRQLASEESHLKYIPHEGNQPSRIVKLKIKRA